MSLEAAILPYLNTANHMWAGPILQGPWHAGAALPGLVPSWGANDPRNAPSLQNDQPLNIPKAESMKEPPLKLPQPNLQGTY